MSTASDSSAFGDRHSAIEQLLLEMNARLLRMERLHQEMLVKRPRQKDLAKQMGVHPTTLSRRRKRERMRLLVNGSPL